jgi:hypothetical protein
VLKQEILSMNRLLVFLGCLIVLGVVFGCQSDIVLPPDAPLAGSYVGTYTYIEDYRDPQTEKTYKMQVTFEFGETTYHMNLDTAYETEDTTCFCAVDGEYALTEGVRLREDFWVPDEAYGCNSCNETQNPEGVFVRETKGDSLILKLQDGTIFKMLRLLKVSD